MTITSSSLCHKMQCATMKWCTRYANVHCACAQHTLCCSDTLDLHNMYACHTQPPRVSLQLRIIAMPFSYSFALPPPCIRDLSQTNYRDYGRVGGKITEAA